MDLSEENKKFLLHYGVLGMRWGKRKGGRLAPTLKFKDPKTGEMVVRYDARSAFKDLGLKSAKAAITASVLAYSLGTFSGSPKEESARNAVKAAILAIGIQTVKKVVDTAEF